MEMLSKGNAEPKGQLTVVCLEDLVPEDHLLRKVSRVLTFDFIYDLVKERYSETNGRSSIDPVVLVKMVLIQYLFGIRSMRQTVREIEVNVAYRWFLGLGLTEALPHFTTFGKNYKMRFEGSGLFEAIFERILLQCYERGLVQDGIVYVDATHIKASANRHKRVKVQVAKEAAAHAQELRAEINADREAHGKKPFDDDDDDESGSDPEEKTVTRSTTDPERGMFAKGEHQRNFAYMAQTVCDGNGFVLGFVLGYEMAAGNVHDSVSFPGLYARLKALSPD